MLVFSIQYSVKITHESLQPFISQIELICLREKKQKKKVPNVMCLNLWHCLWSNALFLSLWVCEFVRLSLSLSHCVIELVLSAGRSHQSFSDGQSSSILYANCLLLNMLHQSGLIMTLFQHPALFQQMRPSGWGRERETGNETLHEQSRTQIQM